MTKNHAYHFQNHYGKIQLYIIRCYAPTNDKDEGTKYDFYKKLQTVLDKMKEKEVTILMGDFNAKIWSHSIGHEEVMGTHGIGEMNENGEMFAEFCSVNILIIGGSVFPHRRIHKATWVSPGHRTENQTDHICISHKCITSMQAVRVHRWADAASNADKTKVKAEEQSWKARNFLEFLKDKQRMEIFRHTLSNKYETLRGLLDGENMEVNPHWECPKWPWSSTCMKKLCGRKIGNIRIGSRSVETKLQVRKENKTVPNNCTNRSTKVATSTQ